MTSSVTNPMKAFALIALGLAIAAMGIYVANADDAPGAAVIGFLLMLAAVLFCRRARATCARRGTPSMLVPSSCRLGKSSIFLRRIVGPMFMRVNSKCVHQVRPPLAEQ